jgi:hypothetical protein
MEFFNVTTRQNLDTIVASVDKHRALHDFDAYQIICQSKDEKIFKETFQSVPKVNIINEDKIISLDAFCTVVDEITAMWGSNKINPQRTNWYYQQVLKLTYALENSSHKIVMWDADSVPLTPIKFFDSNCSRTYGSLIEYHHDYFLTLKNIFAFAEPKFACTVQFFSLTTEEKVALENILQKYLKKKNEWTVAEWLTRIIIGSICQAKKDLKLPSSSYFSEQELVGLSNLKNNDCHQIKIKHFRPRKVWKPTLLKIRLLLFLGYKYYTVENAATRHPSWILEFIFYSSLVSDVFRQSIQASRRCLR